MLPWARNQKPQRIEQNSHLTNWQKSWANQLRITLNILVVVSVGFNYCEDMSFFFQMCNRFTDLCYCTLIQKLNFAFATPANGTEQICYLSLQLLGTYIGADHLSISCACSSLELRLFLCSQNRSNATPSPVINLVSC